MSGAVRNLARRGLCGIWRHPWAPCLVVILLTGACSSPAQRAANLPAGPPTVTVTMREYGFDYPPEVPAGRVVFRVHNAGQEPHDLSLLPLGEEVPPIDQQLRGSTRRIIAPYAAIPPRPPAANGSFAVDLMPGRRYALICFLANPDGKQHALLGMSSEFRAGGSQAPKPGP